MALTLEQILSQEEISSISAPIESARTFPNKAYTSEDFYDLEVRKIYLKKWVAAFFIFDVANIGDAYPFSYFNMPLVAVRGDDNKIRVFHNVSPYDGCPLVLEPTLGMSKLISPYHGWEYDLRGRLIAIPYWDGTKAGNLDAVKDFDVDLVEVATGAFLSTVFINLSDQPEKFEEYIQPIINQFDEHDFDLMEVGLNGEGHPLVTVNERETNWKTFYENSALNILHENFVHDFYDVSPEVPRIKEDGVPSFHEIIDGDLLALGFYNEDFPKTYSDLKFPHLGKNGVKPNKECFGTHYPNFYISFAPTFVEITYLLPDGPDQVREREAILFHKDIARDPAYAKRRAFISGVFAAASLEDGRICEEVHAARHSPAFDQKFYSPFWDKLHYLMNKMILDDLKD